jgi:phage antirepressor YoqD-like protein
LIPVKSVKPTEVYAPNYRDGEQVVLIRFPHGGIFEIPELTVNNRNPDAKKLLGQARDAIGINAKVAQKLSGADFDGDAVIVIPNGTGAVKTAPSLEKLKDFDPKATYKKYEGMDVMSEAQTGTEMGKITNLIADMSIRGAKPDELARAVRHSMVVIDAHKHELNYKQSAIDNGITALKTKYQGGPTAGASTLITKAGSEIRVPEKKLRKHSQGGPIDPATGKLVWVPTNETYTKTTKTGLVKTKPVEMKTNPMAETHDAFTLSSGTAIESVYAQHANNMKALANEARKTFVETPPLRYDKTARKVYAKEVASLDAKLNIALKNAPRERKAQILAYTVTSMKKEQNPEMSYAQYKKIAGQALYEARNRTGAGKQRIYITDEEWTAIQAGAVSHGKLESILANANTDRFRDLATPKAKVTMTPLKLGRAQSMLNSGYSQADVADALGVSVSTLKQAIG